IPLISLQVTLAISRRRMHLQGPTLFPYTTLFRSSGVAYIQATGLIGLTAITSDGRAGRIINIDSQVSASRKLLLKAATSVWLVRSEEHTSELQSRENIVCRLLLGKKKTLKARNAN